jgi:hypothetical protein
MPRLLDYLSPLYAWLAALDPSLPRALFVALVFATVLAWRKLSPGSWKKFSGLLPISDADTNWFKATLLKTWQALPSAALGLVYGALGTGADVWSTLKLGLLGLLAPVIHEVAWRYQGNLGQPKPPSSKPDDTDTTISIMPEPVKLVAQDRSRLHNDRPDEPAEMSGKWRHEDWRLQVVFGALLACVLSCGAASKLPCDESKLRAIDADYAAKVIAVCLPKYDSKEDCPEWAALQAEHRRQLKEACP